MNIVDEYLHGDIDTATVIVRISAEPAKILEKETARREGWTLLHAAVSKTDIALIEHLLEIMNFIEQDQFIDTLSFGGSSALSIAAGNGNKNVFDILLNNGADIVVKGDSGFSAAFCGYYSRSLNIKASTYDELASNLQKAQCFASELIDAGLEIPADIVI